MSDRNNIALVKSAYDIVDYIDKSGVALKQSGVGSFKGLCPFHADKTPSFTVSEHFQNYKCWSCGASGDLISYVMDSENLSFVDSLKILAENKGIVLDLKDSTSKIDYESHHKILRLAANFYCKKFNELEEDSLAKKEISKRHLSYDNSNPDWIKYGYAPAGNQLYKYLKSKGFEDDLLVEAGVCRKNSDSGVVFDFFRSRLIFIFTDRYGKPVGFSSRKLLEDDKYGKYVNSPESPLFHKSKVLYNHVIARKASGESKVIYINEGQFDVAAYLEDGLPNSVAASGTAFTREHLLECKKMVGEKGKIVFSFDGDEAGMKAAYRAFVSFPDYHDDLYCVIFPEGKDPSDYLLENGPGSLKKYVESNKPLVEFILDRIKTEYDFSSTLGRSKYISAAAEIVKTIPNLTLREQCIKIVSLESSTSLSEIRQAVDAADAFKFSVDLDSKSIASREEDSVEENVEVLLDSDKEEDSSEDEISVELLEDLIKNNFYYETAFKFISLGIVKPSWRQSVVNSIDLVPNEFKPFVRELENHLTVKGLFPESFENVVLAKFFMSREFSPFYRLMSQEELRDHIVYLHDKLEDSSIKLEKEEKRRKVIELLSHDDSNSVEYYERIVSKSFETI